MEESSLVQTLAIWGAITGTIGTVAGIINLVLRFRQQKRDQPRLQCHSDFSFEHSPGNVRPLHKIVVRSTGRRPVTVDFVRYCMRPKMFWHAIFKNRYWSKGLWVYDQKPRNEIHLPEGKKTDIKIRLPDGFPLRDVLKTEIHDQAGITWKVSWPTFEKLKKLIHHERLHESEESNDGRMCKIVGYATGRQFHLYVQWNPKSGEMNSFKGRFFHFREKSIYEGKLDDLLSVQRPKLLAGEIEEVI